MSDSVAVNPTTEESFKKAAEESKKLQAKPTNDELLDLYALFKIGEGNDFNDATAPGMFDLKGKAKYNSWKKHAEENKTTKEQAWTQYVELVETLKAKYGYDENKEAEAVGA